MQLCLLGALLLLDLFQKLEDFVHFLFEAHSVVDQVDVGPGRPFALEDATFFYLIIEILLFYLLNEERNQRTRPG